ncbi:MAG: hypothetical protein ACREJB_08745 [Planctomycetaceae bacterium]
MTIADDYQLLQLSRQPARELFPLLRRARSMTPLIIVVAFAPALLALKGARLSDADARWGLAGLDVLTASSWQQALDPPASGDGPPPLQWRSPLTVWMTAGVIAAAGADQRLGRVAMSCLTTTGMVLMAYVLLTQLGGPRIGFWTALILGCHAVTLTMARHLGPTPLAIALAMTACWGFFGHVLHSRRAVSLRLLLGGAALGLCALTSGPVFLIVPAILLAYVLTLRGSRRKRRSGETPAGQRWIGWPAARSWGVLMGIALVAGGWWVLLMTVEHGWGFLSEWLTGPRAMAAATPPIPVSGGWRSLAEPFVSLLGPLIGLTVLGAGLALRDVIAGAEDRPWRAFLLAWGVTAGVLWIVGRETQFATEPIIELFRGFLVVPCIALAALAIHEADQRRVGVLLMTGVTAATLVALAVMPFSWQWQVPGPTRLVWWSAMALVLVVASGWLLRQYVRDRDGRARPILVGLVLVQVLAAISAGLWSVRQPESGEPGLQYFREGLADVSDIDSITLISERPPSPRLVFVLRLLEPHAEFQVQRGWDAVFAHALAQQPGDRRRMLVADHSSQASRSTTVGLAGLEIDPVSEPQFFERRLLRAFLVTAAETQK